MTLAELPIGHEAVVREVRAEQSYRVRLMELGLLPGTRVRLHAVAPAGDPFELVVRGTSLSLRRREALGIVVTAEVREPATELVAGALPARP